MGRSNVVAVARFEVSMSARYVGGIPSTHATMFRNSVTSLGSPPAPEVLNAESVVPVPAAKIEAFTAVGF